MDSREQKLHESMDALADLGLHGRQANKLAAYVLLAMLDLRPNTLWSECSNPLLGVTPVMTFIAIHYDVHYAPNTRESVRDEAIRPFTVSRLLVKNPDDPSRKAASAKTAYQITPEALALLKTFGGPNWREAVKTFRLQFPLPSPDLELQLGAPGTQSATNSRNLDTVPDNNLEDAAKPEGFEEDEIELGAFPMDSLMIRNETRSVFEICRRIDAGQCILNPDFQRSYVWDLHKQTKLIESCLLRIPLPVFYLAEAKDGKIIVVDGLQRLNTFHRYLRGKFTLEGLQYPEANDCSFDQLPPTLQTRIEDMPLTLYLIDSKVPEEAQYEIFQRVNGGVPLTRQQMRNCIYIGSGTRWLREMADTPEFLAATSGGLNAASMRDRECINRFGAFTIFGFEHYRGRMDTFLGDALKAMNQSPSLSDLTERFIRTMSHNYILFRSNAFRRSIIPYTKRSVLNVALFDVFTYELGSWTKEDVVNNLEAIRLAAIELLQNDRFIESISRSTNSVKSVRTRFTMAHEAFLGIQK